MMGNVDDEKVIHSFKASKIWHSIARISRTIPFGYKPDPEDPDLLLPILLELEALERAKLFIRRGYSYREVADWLFEVTNRRISHMGLKKRLDHDRANRNRLASLRLSARRAQEAVRKAEKAAAKAGSYIPPGTNSDNSNIDVGGYEANREGDSFSRSDLQT